MPGSSTRLSRLQHELLEAFFERTRRFFLTGGGALAGYYLHHRETKDLDLFASTDVDIEEGARALRSACAAIGAMLETVQQYPDFRRFSVSRGQQLTLVDLVIDRAPQLTEDKPAFGVVRVDALEEIAVNKVCSLLGRAEVRDLVDLHVLLDQGYDLESLLLQAQEKDGGVNPAALAWVLSELSVGPRSPVPGGYTAEGVDEARRKLVKDLARLAFPGQEDPLEPEG